jgi:hypothetical protein
MAFSYYIDTSQRVVTVRPEGPPSIEDWEDLLDQVAADPLFRPGFHIVSDRRHLQIEPDAAYVRATVEAVVVRRAAFAQSRFAVLTAHLPTYGMARMAEALAENRGIQWRVFTDAQQAEQWFAETREPS